MRPSDAQHLCGEIDDFLAQSDGLLAAPLRRQLEAAQLRLAGDSGTLDETKEEVMEELTGPRRQERSAFRGIAAAAVRAYAKQGQGIGDSDLDDEQPVVVQVVTTLGELRDAGLRQAPGYYGTALDRGDV